MTLMDRRPTERFGFLLVLLLTIGLLDSLPQLLRGRNDLVSAASDPVIAAAGDIACDPADSNFNNGDGNSSNCRQLYTSDLLVNTNLAAVLALGDVQYYCGSYQAFLQSYDLSWGRIKSITHPAVGNHEYLTHGGSSGSTDCTASNSGAAGYFEYYGSAAGTAGQGYYSFDIGAWHLIALNSNCSDAGGCGTSSAQYKWLQSDLTAHPNQCTLAFWHIPLYSSGGRASSNSQPFWNLLYAYHADVVLNGHDHIYERFAQQDPSGLADPNGIREFIVGTGGSDHTTITSIAANSELRNTNTYGVLELTLHAASYDWQFVPEAGKTFTDSGSNGCHSSSSAQTATPTFTATNTPTPTPAGTLPATDTPTPTPTAPTTGNQSFTFTPVADAYVDSSNPTVNRGTLTTIRIDGSPIVNSYIRFDVSGLSGPITQVKLLIHANSSGNQGIRIMSVADNTWGETTINYNNAPPMGNLLATSTAFSSGTWVTLDVTAYITGNGIFSFGVTDPNATAISMAARESGANAEQLVVSTSDSTSPTATLTPTATQMNTDTPTFTPTPTNALAMTATPTFTATPTETMAVTNTPAFTPTPTITLVVSATPTVTPTMTDTLAVTITPTFTSTPTNTLAVSATPTFTPTDTSTVTNTPTFTPTPTNIPSITDTPTFTPTQTNISTATNTPTPTPTATSSGGQTFTFTPEADAYVDASNPTVNKGTTTTIRVDGSPIVNTYIRFTVSGVTGTIVRVRLLIFANSAGNQGIVAHSVADNTWGETTITYNNAPTIGSVLASSAAFSSGIWVTMDVTPFIAGEGTYSFGITDPSATAISLAARESGVNAAQLIIDTQ
jgi:hypothetical protein